MHANASMHEYANANEDGPACMNMRMRIKQQAAAAAVVAAKI
jgi:hypothetical protein